VNTKPAPPASYADFEDEKPLGPLRVALQFIAIPLLIVGVAVGLYVGINLMVGTGPRSAKDFVQLLRSDTINRRWQAAYELADRLRGGEIPAEFRDPQLVSALCAALDQARREGEDPPRLACAVLGILRRLEDPASLPAVRAAVDDHNPWVRSYAILALGRLDDTQSRPRLVDLTRHEDPGTRQAALEALAEMDQVEGRPYRLSAETRDLVLAHLGDPAEDVRFTAALILADAGGREALPVLLRMLDREYLDQFPFEDQWGGLSLYKTRSRVILEAVGAVVKLGAGDDPQVLAALERLADDQVEGDAVVREAATEAIHRLRKANQ